MPYQNDPQKCLTGEIRCSYVSVHTPRQINNQGKPKYTMTALIPKSDANTIADIRAAMQAAVDAGIKNPKIGWGGVRPPYLVTTLYDGDGSMPKQHPEEPDKPWGEECKGHWVLRASANEGNRPQVVGMDNIKTELDPRDVYSGMYARITIRFYPYKFAGKCGIGCGLGNILKTRDGEPLAGVGASAESDFAGIGAAPVMATQAQQGVRIDPVTGLPMA